jgi:hypothetical protein
MNAVSTTEYALGLGAQAKAASALIEHLTGEHEDSNLIEPDVLAQ